MELIKKQFKRLKRLLNTWPRRLVLCLGILIFLVAIYLLVLFLSVSRSELALAELQKSFVPETICHEKCYLWRQDREKLVVADLKNDSNKIKTRIIDYWNNPAINLEFKKELIRILSLAYGEGNPPEYLKDYLAAKKSDPALIKEIISQFNHNQETVNDEEIDNYFELLQAAEPLDIKQEAIKNISATKEKIRYFTRPQLVIIEKLIFNSETDSHLRWELILLLGDYYLVFPAESAAIWQKIYDNQTLDNISRAFSADNLNHLTDKKLLLPVVSSAQWAEYYN